MPASPTRFWRGAFLIAAALILLGGPRHPTGTMAEMLANVAGVLAHGAAAPLVVAGAGDRFRVLFFGLAWFAVWVALAALWPRRAEQLAPIGATR